MRDSRGFALLAALWLTVAITIVAASSLALGREGLSVSSNRIVAARAQWAAEGCHAILDARFAADQTIRQLDTIDLGSGSWCTARLSEPGARLNLNQATADQLTILLGADSLRDALLDWIDADTLPRPLGAEQGWYRTHGRVPPANRPLSDISELSLIRGFDSATVERILPFVTTVGDGRIDLGTAPLPVLATLPGMTAEGIALVQQQRRNGQPIGTAEELMQRMSPSGQASLAVSWAQLQPMVATAPTLFEATFSAGVRGHGGAIEIHDLVVPDGPRLAVVRRIVP